MREKRKTPEKQLSHEEILSLQEKDFRLSMLNSLEAANSRIQEAEE